MTAHRILALPGPGQRSRVEAACRSRGFLLSLVGSLDEVLERLEEERWDATVLSLSAEGVEPAVARRLVEDPRAGGIVLTVPGASLRRSVEAHRAGAHALLREPLDPEEVAEALARSVGEDGALELGAPTAEEVPHLLGSSRAMARLFEEIAPLAALSVPVLVVGEPGSGRTEVARAIHRSGPRSEGPFVVVDCAALPEHLLEPELFGLERGGLLRMPSPRPGALERAEGGTIVLGSIEGLGLRLQSGVLRALEEGIVERPGGDRPVAVDVRVVASATRELGERVRSGAFRVDLQERLAAGLLEVPPLRERMEDVAELASHFTALFARRYGRPVRALSEEVLRRLHAHPWPGNVRELRNVLDRAVQGSRGETLRAADLRLGEAAPRLAPREPLPPVGYPPDFSLEEVEAAHIERVLEHTDGHVAEAAAILGIHRNTLSRKLAAARGQESPAGGGGRGAHGEDGEEDAEGGGR